jgi:transposase
MLFEAPLPSAEERAGTSEASKRAVRFVDPDPALIRINEVRLDELLKQNGQHAPLQIRTWLGGLSFSEFEQAYEPGGRPPYAPRAMVGVILSGIVQGISSLRDLERFARLDLGCWWISGGIMPDHSILGRFIQRHTALLTEGFFEQLTREVLRLTHSGTALVAGDGTVIEAAASRYRQLRAEALAQRLAAAREAAQAAPQDAHLAAQCAQLERAQEILERRRQARTAHGRDASTLAINPQEPEACVQPQKDAQRYLASYKPVVLANEARVIVCANVHASSETAPLPALLDRAQAQSKIETALLDAGFFSAEVIAATQSRQIELLCPEGQSEGADWNKRSDKQYPKSRFAYDAAQDCYRCPAGERLTPMGQYRGNAKYPGYVVYATKACGTCALRAQCTRSPEGRRLKRYAGDGAKDALRAKMAQPEVQARYRQRQAMVEPVFSALRYTQGLQRFRRKGLAGVRLEFALHALAYNLGRALACALIAFLARLMRACRSTVTDRIAARALMVRRFITLRAAPLCAN